MLTVSVKTDITVTQPCSQSMHSNWRNAYNVVQSAHCAVCCTASHTVQTLLNKTLIVQTVTQHTHCANSLLHDIHCANILLHNNTHCANIVTHYQQLCKLLLHNTTNCANIHNNKDPSHLILDASLVELGPLCLLARQVRVTIGDLGLSYICVMSLEH